MSPTLEWYHAAVIRAARRARNARWFFRWIALTQVIALLSLAQCTSESMKRSVPLSGIDLLLATLGLFVSLYWVAMLLRIVSSSWQARTVGRELIRSGRLYRPPPAAVAEISQISRAFARHLAPPGSPPPDIECWVLRSLSLVPSIVHGAGSTKLCLPLGFMRLFRTTPVHAKAMLAHEVSHLVQKDAQLWQLSRVAALPLYRLLMLVMVTNCALSLVFAIVALFRFATQPELFGHAFAPGMEIVVAFPFTLAITIVYGMLFRHFSQRILFSRYASEFLADVGAALCMGLREHCECIEIYAANVTNTPTHPARQARMDVTAKLFDPARRPAESWIFNIRL